MKMRSKVLWITGALLVSIIAVPASSSGTTVADYSTTNSPFVEGTDEAAVLFDPLDISEIQLTTPTETIDYFRYCCNWEYEGPWMEAQLTMTVKGVTVGPIRVGFHLKGAWGSWRNIDGKPGIKIKVNAFDPDQRLFGVKKLILNNMAQDGPFLNQQVSSRLFRAMGVPASRSGYTHLEINNTNYGVYTLMESLDKVSLARWFESTQHLYKGGVPYHWADIIPDHEYVFQVDTGSLTDRSDLMPLLQANVSGDWWTEVNKVADMQEIVREWAVEALVGHWDGYAYNGNNYFLHSDDNGIFTMMPWGIDNTWGGIMDFHYPGKLMPQLCLQNIECKSMYEQAIADTAYAIDTLDLHEFLNQVAEFINPKLEDQEAWNRHEWFFTNSVPEVQNYQSWSLWNVDNNFAWPLINYQESNGNSEVKNYDSALSRLVINGQELNIPVAENNLEKIYLPVGTTSVNVQATTRQGLATKQISGNTSLEPGENTISIDVTSANGLSTQRYEVSAYVYSKATKTQNVVFAKTKVTLTNASKSALRNMGISIGINALDEIVLRIYGPVTKYKLFKSQIIETLEAAGMPSPVRSIFIRKPAMAKNNFRVVATYIN